MPLSKLIPLVSLPHHTTNVSAFSFASAALAAAASCWARAAFLAARALLSDKATFSAAAAFYELLSFAVMSSFLASSAATFAWRDATICWSAMASCSTCTRSPRMASSKPVVEGLSASVPEGSEAEVP